MIAPHRAFGFDSRYRFGSYQRQPLNAVQTSVASGDTINTTSSETAFATTKTIPANTMRAGQVYRILATGKIGTDAATPGNWQLKFKFGSTLICQTASSAIAANIDRSWFAEIFITVISTGAGGTVEAAGWWNVMNNASAATPREMPNSAVVSLDTTVDLVATFTITMSVSDLQNTITLRQLHCLLLNP